MNISPIQGSEEWKAKSEKCWLKKLRFFFILLFCSFAIPYSQWPTVTQNWTTTDLYSAQVYSHRSVKFTFCTFVLFGFGLFPNLRAVSNLVTTAHVLHRKEVIQPHLPIRLPCYDLTPIIEPTFDCCLLAVSSQASGVPNFHGLTGGVYKARERIHRGMLIRDY